MNEITKVAQVTIFKILSQILLLTGFFKNKINVHVCYSGIFKEKIFDFL